MVVSSIRGFLVNNAKFRTCQMARSVVPDGKRYTKNRSIGDGSEGDIVLDEKCPEATPTPPAQCPIDIIEKGLVKTSPLCSLKILAHTHPQTRI